MNLNCMLLCASGAAYDINPTNGVYTPDSIFSKAVDFDPSTLSVISASSTNNTDTDLINACLVGKNASGIIVAFRGTLTPGTPDSFEDWLQDFFAVPVAQSPLPGLVHYGFITALNSIYSQMLTAVKALNPDQNAVYITGHSKGGGLAPLAAYLLHSDGIPITQVVTFAAPKSGNSNFKTGYEAVFPNNHFRYENYGDLVPFMPPSDTFIAALAKALAYIPWIGSDLAALMNEAAGWNYQDVGAEYFIESAAYNYAVTTDETDPEQLADLVWNLGVNILDPITALTNAHSHQCGAGYMNGTCAGSGVCG